MNFKKIKAGYHSSAYLKGKRIGTEFEIRGNSETMAGAILKEGPFRVQLTRKKDKKVHSETFPTLQEAKEFCETFDWSNIKTA